MTRHLRIINKMVALLAEYDSGHRCKHVAAVVKRNKVLSIGFNSLKTSPAVLKISRNHERVCIHAEVSAIGNAQDLSAADLYVVRVDRNGELAMSCPCKDCMRAIDATPLRRVIYTTPRGYHVVNKHELSK